MIKFFIQNSVHADYTTHSETSISIKSFRLPFIVSMTLIVLLIIMIALIAIGFIALLTRRKKKAAMPVVESVTTAEYVDPRPLPLSSNPAYNTMQPTEGPDIGDTV